MFNLSLRQRVSQEGGERPAFQYSPLDLTKREIRLLHLLPIGELASDASGTSTSAAPAKNVPIRCHLTHVNLDDSPSYTALSYAWGESTREVPIEINGMVLYIRENLADALTQIGRELKPSDEFVLWADAICINQTHEAEKGHQVQEMGEIYGKATQVIAWLGKADAQSTFALQSLAEICKCKNFVTIAELKLIASLSESEDMSHDEELQQFRFERKMRNLLHDHDFFKLAKALSHLVGRKWWRRLWVVQEIALSKSAVLKSGSASVSWWDYQNFLDVLDWIGKYNRTHWAAECFRPIIQRPVVISNCWRIIQRGKRPSLLKLLEEIGCHQWLEVSDRRDKVYAVLGLTQDTDRLGIKPDYSLSCEQVYLQVSVALLKRYGTIILSYAIPVAQEERSKKDLPTWVLDFSILVHIPLRELSSNRYTYTANGESSEDFGFWPSESPREFRVKGVLFDTVSWKGHESQWGEFLTLPNLLSKWLRELSRKGESALSNPPKSSGKLWPEYVQEAMWRAPIADRVHSANGKWEAAKPRHRKGYDALLNVKYSYNMPRDGRSSILHSDDDDILNYYSAITRCSYRRRMFMTTRGYIGLGSERLQRNDKICILLGGDVPFILRPTKGNQYRFVGEAYVHGIMSGEFMATDPEVQTFTII